MPGQYEDEKIEEIRDAYREAETYSGAAEAADVSRSTVKKYCEDIEPGGPDDDGTEIPDDVEETMPGNEEAHEPDLFEDPVIQAANAFQQFFHDLNNEHGIGINSKTISMMAGEVRDTGRLPQPANVASFIESASSGLNNNQEIMWVAQRYGQWKEQYEQLAQPFSPAAGQQGAGGAAAGVGAGAGASPGGNQTLSGQGLTEGGFPVDGRGGGGGGPAGAQGGAGAFGGGGGGHGNDPNQQLVTLLRQLIHQQSQNQPRQQGQGGGQREGESRVQRLRELKEEKEILEEIAGGDDRLAEVEQQIASIQQFLQEGMHQQQDQESKPQAAGDTVEDRLLGLAAQGHADLQEVLAVIEDRQQNVPVEVRKKELETQVEEKKLDHQKQKYEAVGNALENMAQKAGDALGQRLTEDPGGGAARAGARGRGGGGDAGAGAGGGAQAPRRRDSWEHTQSTAHHQPMPNGGQPAADPTAEGEVGAREDGEGGAEDARRMANGGPNQPAIAREECPECAEPTLINAGEQSFCEACEYTVGPCDLCGYPVEVPPRGEAKTGKCPECESEVAYPPAGDHSACEADGCEWSGNRDDLGRPHVRCEGCDQLRPIVRREDLQQMQMQMQMQNQKQGQTQGQADQLLQKDGPGE